LQRKLNGESSMSGTAGCSSKPSKLHAGQGPDDMVKTKLFEPQCPLSKQHCSGLTVYTQRLSGKLDVQNVQPQGDHEELVIPLHAP